MVDKIKRHREPLPIRASSKIKEDDSRIVFESVIRPWMICSWIQRDFGIDAIIEITKPISNSKDQIVTGKRFSAQLKSSDTKDFNKDTFSLSVPKEKITYWYGALEPVLLIYIDLNSKRSFYRWIDSVLIDELFKYNQNWIARDSVSVKFSKDHFISQKSLIEIEKHVIHWKRPFKTILTPGNYFKFSQSAKSFIDLFISRIDEYRLNFLPKEAESLKKSSSQPIYTIAIVGPSRVGKSTLINCLLQKEVSPVGMLPTTGIPITIFPKDENKSIVVFKDNKEITGPSNCNFLREYTSQELNPRNRKNVKLVTVNIINTLLEKGFALCDVPGLDDPDKEIRVITKTALLNVNAIIYVIDASPMRSGGFSINKQMIDDLNELGRQMDRCFLVFNKIDELTDAQLLSLKKYINDTLEEYKVLNYLPSEPLYISSGKSYENRVNNFNTDDTVGVLENEIWTYLLSQNKTGLHKLIGSFSDCLKLIEQHRNIINARMFDTKKREDLEIEIRKIQNEIHTLSNLVLNHRQKIYVSIRSHIIESFENILSYLKTVLEDISINERLPENHKITAWLENNVFQTLTDACSFAQNEIYELQSIVNKWISEKLKQVEIRIDGPDILSNYSLPDINRYANQIDLYYYGSKQGYIGLLETILQGIGNIFEGIFDAIANLFISDIEKRNKQIKEIISKSRKSYNNITKDFLKSMNDYLIGICNYMEEKSIDRTNVYLGELSAQISNLNKPLSAKEKNSFKTFLNEILQVESGIASNLTHLKDYTESVE